MNNERKQPGRKEDDAGRDQARDGLDEALDDTLVAHAVERRRAAHTHGAAHVVPPKESATAKRQPAATGMGRRRGVPAEAVLEWTRRPDTVWTGSVSATVGQAGDDTTAAAPSTRSAA